MNNKKAQVYVFTAILISTMMLGIVSLNSVVFYKGDTFKPVVENYKDELYYVVNNTVYNDHDVGSAVKDYTEHFIWYSSKRNLDVKVVAMVYNTTAITIINEYGKTVTFERAGLEFDVEENSMNTTTNFHDAKLHSGEDTYNFKFQDEGVRALIKRDHEGNIQIYKI